jgi:ABC-type arginine transport system permease subunit
VFAAAKGNVEEEIGFFSSLASKFERTFIKEDRWMLFAQGAGTTLLITVLSALFGTILGFLLYMLCKKSSLIDKVNGFISWLIGGIPTVLLLMVLYYIVFVGKATIGGIWVAIICFTILFGYAVLYRPLRRGSRCCGTLRAGRGLPQSDQTRSGDFPGVAAADLLCVAHLPSLCRKSGGLSYSGTAGRFAPAAL